MPESYEILTINLLKAAGLPYPETVAVTDGKLTFRTKSTKLQDPQIRHAIINSGMPIVQSDGDVETLENGSIRSVGSDYADHWFLLK